MKIPQIANDCRTSDLDATLGRLNDAVAAATSARQQLEQRLDAATVQRQMEFDAELMREVTKRQKLAKALGDTAAALQNAERQAVAERQAAADQAARCQESFEAALRQEVARRQAVEEEFAHLRAASEEVRIGLLDQVAMMRQHEARLEADLAHRCAEYVALQETLEQTRTAAQEALGRASVDRATERARHELVVEERNARLEEMAVASNRDSLAIAQLQEQLEALSGELETTKGQRDVLKTTADLVPLLHKQIDEIRADHRHRFNNTPVSMFRCGRDGAITQVNHALATLLGYDAPNELQDVDFAATVFDSGDELQWIVDRCFESQSTESLETTWKRKDGTRVIVRVVGVAADAESIDLVAQDVTSLREIEEKLRNSQRMEAVARYASEVAVNCDNLLRHVKEEGEQWLPRINSDAARYQAELLLDEVARASGFLRQLAVYGNEQKKIPELVEVNKVLRDMEPVLKRVAGDNIELVLPKASAPLNLDVDAERVERMLVNVAAYGRERMPLGGRLMIEVASVVVDRKFTAKHPNVRPGAHVLLTVNEVRGPVRSDFLALHTQASGAEAIAMNPGVDLGALQALVSDCGGHLWMMAEPPGDMVLKIHLPRRVLDHLDPRAAAKTRAGSRWIKRLPGMH